MKIGLLECHQFPNDKILFVKSLNPTVQVLELFRRQVLAVVQRPVEVLGQHVLVEALAGQAPRRISAGKVLVRSPGAVEVAPAADVVDLASDGEVHGRVVLAAVFQERARRVGLEDDRGRAFGEHRRLLRLHAEVEECAEEEE